jgi:hypothetical protein
MTCCPRNGSNAVQQTSRGTASDSEPAFPDTCLHGAHSVMHQAGRRARGWTVLFVPSDPTCTSWFRGPNILMPVPSHNCARLHFLHLSGAPEMHTEQGHAPTSPIFFGRSMIDARCHSLTPLPRRAVLVLGCTHCTIRSHRQHCCKYMYRVECIAALFRALWSAFNNGHAPQDLEDA